MRLLLCTVLFLLLGRAYTQNRETDSLKKLLDTAGDTHRRVSLLESLSFAYLSANPDTALHYASAGLELARSINDKKGEASCINALGNVYFQYGDNPRALEMYLQYLKLKEGFKKPQNLAIAYFNIAGVYTETGDYRLALSYIFKAMKEDEISKDSAAILYDNYSLGSNYQRMNRYDSALYYIEKSHELAKVMNDKNMMGAILNTFGAIYLQMNDTAKAFQYYQLSIPFTVNVNDNEVLNADYFGLAKIFEKRKQLDSAIFYSQKALAIARDAPYPKQVLEISEYLTGLFKTRKQFDSAFFYKELNTATRDSLFSIDQLKKVYNIKIQEQERQQALETAKTKFRNQVKTFLGIFILAVLAIVAIILWRNNKQKQQANLLLSQQKQKVEQTLTELKSTQALLVQSEKMASLGQLTAGIAHEIQNPLNFINNFSELNSELLSELQTEIGKGNMDEVRDIAHILIENEKKINQHGKRADGIVKGMLQHSQTSSGHPELTDINALAEEYIRLSYHGFQAKNKDFKAVVHSSLDETIEKIEIIPGDIGRVLLNLFNNAFYAVNEKSKQHIRGYSPVVSVVTRKTPGHLELTVEDNGNGIPENLLDKIFHPFFTTKPTGQGTGLGLSLSYDIVKAHGGSITVNTKDGMGTGFIVRLPV